MSPGTRTVIFKYLAKFVCYRAQPKRNDASCNGKLSRPRCGDPGVIPSMNSNTPDCLDMQFPNKPNLTNYGDIGYHDNATMDEWQAAADVLDRVFLWIFTAMFLVIGVFELTA